MRVAGSDLFNHMHVWLHAQTELDDMKFCY